VYRLANLRFSYSHRFLLMRWLHSMKSPLQVFTFMLDGDIREVNILAFAQRTSVPPGWSGLQSGKITTLAGASRVWQESLNLHQLIWQRKPSSFHCSPNLIKDYAKPFSDSNFSVD
jgi:hypothetical protein